ncbi:hypothetical protein AVEN_120289-1 [Araneus ventricosus]|uniref:Uncharacterized protein n=1 Tax=Araneus ventricosus TaxID=182803 RepID=A0A4Y2TR81_ARAVE|nr:hypothetical protein AVEN_120289-1 [Araneus ventricosus]
MTSYSTTHFSSHQHITTKLNSKAGGKQLNSEAGGKQLNSTRKQEENNSTQLGSRRKTTQLCRTSTGLYYCVSPVTSSSCFPEYSRIKCYSPLSCLLNSFHRRHTGRFL